MFDSWCLIGYHAAMSPAIKASSFCNGSDGAHRSAIARALKTAREAAGLSLRELAARASTSHATLSAYEQCRKVPAATTLLRILEACGNAVELQIQPRIREANGIPRGDELAAVLKLAGQFPASASRHLPYPPFPKAQ